jgi:hypothetical protein
MATIDVILWNLSSESLFFSEMDYQFLTAKLLNVNIAIIQQAFGHSSSSTTENYMEDFDDKIIDEVNQKIVG